MSVTNLTQKFTQYNRDYGGSFSWNCLVEAVTLSIFCKQNHRANMKDDTVVKHMHIIQLKHDSRKSEEVIVQLKKKKVFDTWPIINFDVITYPFIESAHPEQNCGRLHHTQQTEGFAWFVSRKISKHTFFFSTYTYT